MQPVRFLFHLVQQESGKAQTVYLQGSNHGLRSAVMVIRETDPLCQGGYWYKILGDKKAKRAYASFAYDRPKRLHVGGNQEQKKHAVYYGL